MKRPFLLALISAIVSLAACGSLQSMPTQVGDWGWMLPTEDSVWIHEPGQPYHDAFAETRRQWTIAGLGDCPIKRVSVTEHDGPIDTGWGFDANGLVGTSTHKQTSIIIRGDLEPDVRERLVIHEMIHTCGYKDHIGPGRKHEDPRRWRPALSSVEARATCALQNLLCEGDADGSSD